MNDRALPRAIAVVADRGRVDDLAALGDQMGGGWADLMTSWPPDFRFAVAVAATPARVNWGAPLILYAKGIADLPTAIRHACAQLSDVKCAWGLLVEGEALAIARRETLRDAMTQGAA